LRTSKIDISVAKRTAATSDTVVIVAGTIITEIKSIVVAVGKSFHHRGERKMLGSGRRRIFPFIDSTLGAEQESFFSFPSFSYGYQNRACFDIL